MLGAFARALAVNGLRACDDNFFYRQILLADNLEHLRCSERINLNKFGDLRHVTAIRSLMKDNIDLVQGSSDGIAISQIAFDELRARVDPRRLAALVRVRLKIIEHAHFPALAHQQIGNVRADQARAAGHERVFSHPIVVEARVLTCKLWVDPRLRTPKEFGSR